MHLTGIRIRNFMRFRGEHELALEPGIYALVATTDEDPGRSNFIGKSSFLGAIRWALEGCTVCRKRTLDAMVSRDEQDMQVDLEFSDGSFLSRLKRIGKSAELVVTHPNGNGLKGAGAQEAIDGWIGIAPEDRLTTCWSEQGEMARLVRAGSAELTETIERWLRLGRLAEAGESVAERFRRAGQEHSYLVREVAAEEKEADPEAIALLEAKVERLEQEAEEGKERAEASRVAYRNHSLGFRKREVADEIAAIEQELAGLPEIVKSISDPEELQKALDAAKELETKRGERVRQLKVVAAGDFDGKCPISTILCPAADRINDAREENRKALEEAKKVYDNACRATALARLPVNEAADARLKAARETEHRTQKELRLKDLRRRLEDPEFKDVPLVQAGTNPPELLQLPDRTELNEALAELERRKKFRDALETNRPLVEQAARNLKVMRLAAAVLGPEGARRAAAERAVQRVAWEASEILSGAGIGLAVEAVWGRETQKLAEQCGECGAAFGPSQKVKACEGCGAIRGQKVRHEFSWQLSDVSGAADDLGGMALRCAAFRLLRAAEGASWSVAVMDEPLAQLDRTHRQIVGAQIRRMLGASFEQVIVSAHDAGFTDGIPKKILVTGSGKWSKLEIVG